MKNKRIALLGNPNTGKTTIFNRLTGLNQKVGNYPGVTVDKTTGTFTHDSISYEIIDLPGIYSLDVKSPDEEIVLDYLTNPTINEKLDAIIFVGEALNLKRNLFLFSQLKALDIPLVFVLNMLENASKRGIFIDTGLLEKEIGAPVIVYNQKEGEFRNKLLHELPKTKSEKKWIDSTEKQQEVADEFTKRFSFQKEGLSFLLASQINQLKWISPVQKMHFSTWLKEKNLTTKQLTYKDSIKRYVRINEIIHKVVTEDKNKATHFADRFDRFATHPIAGLFLFFTILFFLFQAIYNFSSIPMDFVDEQFALLSSIAEKNLPDGPFFDLISKGIIPGLGGVVIFLPQIILLFLFIGLLEESGYMSRVVFLTDNFMKRLGMSGKSIIPLISGVACAIPAIMGTRTVNNPKERLLTILSIPFVTCSAQFVVYSVMVKVIFEEQSVYGFSLHGVILMALYLLGFAVAFGFSYILKLVHKNDYPSYFAVEMPTYKFPNIQNVLLTVWHKSRAFLWDAGKIIFAVSIILTVLQSYDWKGNHDIHAEESILASAGKTMEPVIRPLGYDWKIGVGILSSFAAREVFVGTMATLYNLEEDAEPETIQNRMRNATYNNSNKKVYNTATGISLLLFYAFALQCISTIAVLKTETGGWKWPILLLIYSSILAYGSAFIAYQILS